MSKATIIGIIAVTLVSAILGAISGSLSMAVTAIVVAGGAHLLEFVDIGTARAIALTMIGGGALLGGVVYGLAGFVTALTS